MRKGKRDRGTAGNVAFFGILKRGVMVYTKVLHEIRINANAADSHKIVLDSVVYKDCYRTSYN